MPNVTNSTMMGDFDNFKQTEIAMQYFDTTNSQTVDLFTLQLADGRVAAKLSAETLFDLLLAMKLPVDKHMGQEQLLVALYNSQKG